MSPTLVASIDLESGWDPKPLRYELVLPFPPSVNRIWKWVKKTVIRDPAYEAWLRHCDGCCLEQLGVPSYRKTITGRYKMTLVLDISRFRQVDLDNCLKAVCDALQRNRIVANDKWAFQINLLWGEVESSHELSPACRVTVEGI